MDVLPWQGTVSDFKNNQRKILADARDGAEMIRGLLFDKLPGYLQTLSASNLEAAFNTGGLSAVITQMASVADAASNFAVDSTTLLSNGTRQHLVDNWDGSTASKV